MTQYLIRRLLISIPLFFGITLIVYGIYALAPGDPLTAILGRDKMALMSPAQIEKMRHDFGFDQPVIVRYAIWLGSALHGDLGYPTTGSKSVLENLQERLGPTLLLMAVSLVLALLFGIPMGIIMALKQYSAIDYILTVIAFANLSIPSFFLGLGMIYIFSLKLNWLPTFGMSTVGDPFSWGDLARHLVMPSMILGIFNAGVWARYTRSSMLEVMHADYVTVARAKGLQERVVIFRHAFRNALLPLITIVSQSLPGLLGGAVITETIFQWPGMGMLSWRATINRDYAVLMGVTLISALMILTSNLIADLAYAWADPRIKYD
ncbi:MAG: ABC transporter permease [Chloroflexi bacterium]|nr:ABC transporter permease [Chloroflexota bacterium]